MHRTSAPCSEMRNRYLAVALAYLTITSGILYAVTNRLVPGSRYDFATNQNLVIADARLEVETDSQYFVWVEAFGQTISLEKAIVTRIVLRADDLPVVAHEPAPKKNRIRVSSSTGSPRAEFNRFFSEQIGVTLSFTRSLEIPVISCRGLTFSLGYDRFSRTWQTNVAHVGHALVGPEWFFPVHDLFALGSRLQTGVAQLYVLSPEYYGKNWLAMMRLSLYVEILLGDRLRLNVGAQVSSLLVTSPINVTFSGLAEIGWRF